MIKSHIINNFMNDNIENIKEAVNESIKDDDEITLPGLGVFFSLLWEEADDDMKNNILSLIRTGLDKEVEKINK